MATIVLCIVFSVLITSASTSLCNVTEAVGSDSKRGNYFSLEDNNSCYIFAMEPADVKNARKKCRSMGGHLTDIDTEVNNTLQTYISEEMSNHSEINRAYWIGLLWNADLGEWYWENGAEMTRVFAPSSTCSPWDQYWGNCCNCATMSLNIVERRLCTETKSFICKLNLGCHQNSHNVTNTTTCSQRCVKFIEDYKSKTAKSSPTNSPTPSTNFSADGTGSIEDTTEVYNRGKAAAQSNQTDCRMLPDKIDNQTMVILAVLGAVAVILLVAVVVMFAVICKYRRLLNSRKLSPRISLVDILKADSAETQTKRSLEQGGSHPGSTCELLSSNSDNTYSNPNNGKGQAVEASDSIYQNHSQAQGNGSASSPSPASVSGGVPGSVQGCNHEDKKYTLLNRNNQTLENTCPHNVYGEESASAPFEVLPEKSPTYESYL